MRKKGVCCVDQSIEELKQRLFAAMRRMRKSRSHPPLPEGITPTEGFVLMSISQLMSNGKRVRSGDIAKRGHSTPSATSQALKSLEEKGFITRTLGKVDKRQMYFALTKEGRTTLETVLKDEIDLPEPLLSFVQNQINNNQ